MSCRCREEFWRDLQTCTTYLHIPTGRVGHLEVGKAANGKWMLDMRLIRITEGGI